MAKERFKAGLIRRGKTTTVLKRGKSPIFLKYARINSEAGLEKKKSSSQVALKHICDTAAMDLTREEEDRQMEAEQANIALVESGLAKTQQLTDRCGVHAISRRHVFAGSTRWCDPLTRASEHTRFDRLCKSFPLEVYYVSQGVVLIMYRRISVRVDLFHHLCVWIVPKSCV